AWTAFLLKNTATFPRIATTAFFVIGGMALTAAGALSARALGARLAAGQLALRRCFAVLAGPPDDFAAVETQLRTRGIQVLGVRQLSLDQD
ncbi:hypothetical protein J8J27_27385, partial [Mycobacterium tuberculosis]|nr:hypothetical protein [Mycobacterium tuberculosis]